MTIEIGAEAAQFPEKEYINGIAVAVPELIIWWAGTGPPGYINSWAPS
jgi:hypothetical protein